MLSHSHAPIVPIASNFMSSREGSVAGRPTRIGAVDDQAMLRRANRDVGELDFNQQHEVWTKRPAVFR